MQVSRMKITQLALSACLIVATGCNQTPSGGARENSIEKQPVAGDAEQRDINRGSGAGEAIEPDMLQTRPPAALRDTTRRPMATLPAEQSLLRNGAISVEQVGAVIQTRDFAKLIEQFALESATDPLAQDMTSLQSRDMERRLDGVGRLNGFACGLSLCAGSINIGRNNDAYQRFVDASNQQPSNAYSYMDYLADNGDGTFEARFIMSVDPEANGISGRRR